MMTMRVLLSSGEGDLGTIEEYRGAPTLRAIKGRLTRERAGGDRWARLSKGTGDGNLEPITPEEAATLLAKVQS